jgi:hypothetical protein
VKGIAKEVQYSLGQDFGGPSDVAKNETEVGLRLLKKFVGRNQHTNLIVMSVPNRYDLAMELCVNSEIKVFNRKLKKHNKIIDNWLIDEQIKTFNIDQYKLSDNLVA